MEAKHTRSADPHSSLTYKIAAMLERNLLCHSFKVHNKNKRKLGKKLERCRDHKTDPSL